MHRSQFLIEDYSEDTQMLLSTQSFDSRKCVNVNRQPRAQPQVCSAQHIIRKLVRTPLALPVAVRLFSGEGRTISHVTAAAAVYSHGGYQQVRSSAGHRSPHGFEVTKKSLLVHLISISSTFPRGHRVHCDEFNLHEIALQCALMWLGFAISLMALMCGVKRFL